MRRLDPDGDGIFEKTQNFVTDRQGSVVGTLGAAVPVDINNEAAGMKPQGTCIIEGRMVRFYFDELGERSDTGKNAGGTLQNTIRNLVSVSSYWSTSDNVVPQYEAW